MRRRLIRDAGRTAWLAAAAVVAVAAVSVGAAQAEQGAARDSDPPYTLHLTALTGPRGADLMLDVANDATGTPVTVLKKVQLKLYTADGKLDDVRNTNDVAAPGGAATIPLGTVERGRMIEADVLVQPGERSQTYVLRNQAMTKLRPDLVVAAVTAQPQTTTSRPVDVVVDVAERNGDTGASAKVALAIGDGATLGPVDVAVGPNGRASVTFASVTFPAAVPTELRATVTQAEPEETDDTNNTGTATVDVTEHELVTSNVLVPSLGGYGAQFNQHVYAPITNLPPSLFPDLESKVKAFEPQLVRIFYNENWEEPGNSRYDPRNIESFRRTVALAQEAGATINITYQTAAEARLLPVPHMQRFAAALEDLVENRGYDNVRWVTIQNEPNTPGLAITLQQWETLYRTLHAELVARGLRDHIRIMGGDLVESSGARDHSIWFKHMTDNMLDIVDAYSEHIYWWYYDPWRFEFRLRDVRKLVHDDNPVEKRRPSFIIEFGVRGYGTAPGKPPLDHAYYEDGTELRRTNVAAFQQLWFNIASAQLGFTGTSKWDLFWGIYDLSSAGNQSYWTMNPTEAGWELFPTFHALRLFLATTERGWQVVRVEPWSQDDYDAAVRDQPEKELASYVGPNGELTLMGLDSAGRALNGASSELRQYSVGGLAPNTNLTLALWNSSGDGTNSISGTVPVNAAGVARFQVPLHAAFALTTVPVG
jgi:hypothetical protein